MYKVSPVDAEAPAARLTVAPTPPGVAYEKLASSCPRYASYMVIDAPSENWNVSARPSWTYPLGTDTEPEIACAVSACSDALPTSAVALSVRVTGSIFR